jgi:hypothetical protein
MREKTAKLGAEARRVPLDVKRLVLHEAGYKCASPRCRYPLTLDVHHLYYVSEGGSNLSDNLLPLCPNCHAEHHNGNISTESLRAWKMLLLALNEAFDRIAIDLLLMVAQLERIRGITGDGLSAYAALAASGLLAIKRDSLSPVGAVSDRLDKDIFTVALSEKGKLFVEGWRSGDQRAAIELLPTRPTVGETKE